MTHRPARTLLTLVATTAVIAGPMALPASAAPVTVQVLGINDFHGRLSADAAGGPGAALVAGQLAALEAQQPAGSTIVVSAGDNIGASPFVSAVQEDEPTIDVLDRFGVVASAVGNHEFDRGYPWLVDNVGVDGESGWADFPYLGANVEGETPGLQDYEVVEVAGVRVGLVGVVTRQTPSLVAAGGVAGLTFTDPAAAANRVAAQLKDGDAANGEADVVVLLAHEGAGSADCSALTGGSGSFITAVGDDVTAIMTGHTHQAYDCDVDGRPVVQGGEYGNNISQVTLTVDPATGEASATAALVPVLTEGGAAPDEAVAAAVAAAEAEAAVVGSVQVGELTAPVTRAPLSGAGGDERGAESVMGNFVADVQLAATATPELGGAQIALMNPGGLRDDLPAGPITYADAASVQPFANTLVTLSLTGAQVRQVLEEQWQPAGSSRPVLALGVSKGLAFTYDPAAAAGAHITGVTLDGTALDPAATYRVTVNSFLATGGDNFTTLAAGTDRQDNGFNDLDVLVSYLQANRPATADTAPRRAVAAVAAPTPAPVPAPGPSAPVTTRPTTTGTSAPVRAGTGTNRGLTVHTGVEDTATGPSAGSLTAGALAAGGLALVVALGGRRRAATGSRR